jgi:mono/diheme cytochrome c family protein
MKMIPKLVVVACGALALALSAASSGAAQVVVTSDRPEIPRTVASNPKAMFESYCGSCHGRDAKGDGPAGAALKVKPADLTKIAARNGGTFPETRVKRWIEGLDTIESHGDRAMPVWGPLFLQLDPNTPGLIELRVQNLTDYLKSIQQK